MKNNLAVRDDFAKSTSASISPGLTLLTAHAETKQGRPDNALAILDAALEATPRAENPQGRVMLLCAKANTLASTQPHNALAAAREAFDINSNSLIVAKSYTNVLDKMGRADDATFMNLFYQKRLNEVASSLNAKRKARAAWALSV